MNDPHVVALHYEIEHASSIDYSSAEPLELHFDAFDVRVEDSHVRFAMKHHFATERDARDAIDDYIHGWELNATLVRGPNAFKLRYSRSEVEDRKPVPGVINAQAEPILFNFSTSAQATVSPRTYPTPPSMSLKRSPDVESMFHRYTRFREGREPLTTMAYFCLTVLEAATGERRGRRAAAAKRYCISKAVLKQLADLSSTKGGVGARKAEGVQQDLNQQERKFLEAAVTTIIRRVAEVAHDPNASPKLITVQDLPRM